MDYLPSIRSLEDTAFVRYAVAIMAVGVTALLPSGIMHLSGVDIPVLFAIAIIVTGVYGGPGPAIVGAACALVLGGGLGAPTVVLARSGGAGEVVRGGLVTLVVLVLALLVVDRRRANARYRALFDEVPVGLYRADPSGCVTAANPALAALLAYPGREMLQGVPLVQCHEGEGLRQGVQDTLQLGDTACQLAVPFRRFDGTTVWVRHTVRVMRDRHGRPRGHSGVVEDVSTLRRAETAEREARDAELRAIQELASGAAHAINNPLTALMVQLSLLAESVPAGDGASARVQVALGAAGRIQEIVQRLGHIVRVEPLGPGDGVVPTLDIHRSGAPGRSGEDFASPAGTQSLVERSTR